MHRDADDRPRMLTALLLRTEAAICLLAARLALARFSFRRLIWYFDRPAKQPEKTGRERQKAVRAVQRALFHAKSRWAMETTCLQRAMAAQAMLRRRGVGVTLYYGAATLPGQGLRAHAWVQDGETGVVGLHIAQRDGYKILARYPG